MIVPDLVKAVEQGKRKHTMNEKIKELARQADLPLIHDNFLTAAQEKFAKLIVKECCEVAHCNFHVDGLTLGAILKEHFGVEE